MNNKIECKDIRYKKSFTTKQVKRYVNRILENKEDSTEGVWMPTELAEDVIDAININIKAKKFIEDYEKSGKKYIAERIRDGYIGKEVFTESGTSYLQSKRGKPFGTVVAIPLENERIAIGYSIISEDEKFPTPIVGLYFALKRALDAKEYDELTNMTTDVNAYLNSDAKAQIEHFRKRALAYYFPDTYSHSRGKEGKKVVYDNYDEIHERQLKILGEKKVAKNKVPKKEKTSTKETKKVTSKKSTTKKADTKKKTVKK